MNLVHRRLCRSERWAESVEEWLAPWVEHTELGPDVLEIGPGYGATTRVLAAHVPRLTVLEIDPTLAAGLRARFGDSVKVVEGDGAAMPLPDATFSAVTCFTMLHHVPGRDLQDRLFAEACRVLAPGGRFAGGDSLPSFRFRLIHLFDTMVLVDPETLEDRLTNAGFADVEVGTVEGAVTFSAVKPVA